MRNAYLVSCLVDLMKEKLAGYPFPQVDGSCADCNIYRYNIPSTQDAKSYPFVVVRLIECEVEEDFSNACARALATIAFALGIYTQNGPEVAGTLLDELSDAVLSILRKTRLLEDIFERKMPLNLTVPEPDKQWHDFHMATIVSQWDYIIPAEPLFGNKKEYGNLEVQW